MAKNMIKIEAIFGACREREREREMSEVGKILRVFAPWFPHQIHNDAASYKTQHPLSIHHTLKSEATLERAASFEQHTGSMYGKN
jgi:hypothetical protein